MSRTGRRVLLAAGAAVLLLAAGAIVLSRSLRGPLEGPTRHDFGVVHIDTPPAEVEHTFHLVNAGDETLRLRNVVRSCGCASVETSAEVVEPGAPLDVTVTMKLSSATEKRSRITLVLDTAGGREVVRNLFVKARGERVIQ